MSKPKTSFVLHHDTLEVLEEFDLKERGELFTAIYHFQIGKDVGKLSSGVKIAFVSFRKQFERDQQSYLKTCEKNKKIAESRWENLPKVPMVEVGKIEVPEPTKNTDSESDTIKIVKVISDSESKKEEQISIPLPEAELKSSKTGTDEKKFLEMFNRLKKEAFPESSGHTTLDKTDKNNLKRLLERNLPTEKIEACIREMLSTQWIIDSGNHTPKHFVIDANFNRYLNKVEVKPKQNGEQTPIAGSKKRYQFDANRFINNNGQTNVGDSERELSEDTEFTEVE